MVLWTSKTEMSSMGNVLSDQIEDQIVIRPEQQLISRRFNSTTPHIERNSHTKVPERLFCFSLSLSN